LAKKITIEEEYRVQPILKINGELFEWVIENLLKNAVDAIEHNEGKIILSLDRAPDGKSIYLDIKDNGKGINTGDKKNVFKPGFSTKTRGWGLGLSLAKRIVEDYHGGKLFVKDSRIGEGTTFRLIMNG